MAYAHPLVACRRLDGDIDGSFGGLFYALFGTSRQLAMGPTSAIALVVGLTVASMAAGDAERYAAITALTALVVAGLGFLAWLLQLSRLVSFISDTILLGFKAGAALTIAMTQLPKLFGVPGSSGNFFEQLWTLTGRLGDTNFVVFGFGLAALAILVLGERFFPHRPIALLVVVLATAVVSLTSIAERGVATVSRHWRGCRSFASPRCSFAMRMDPAGSLVACSPTSKASRRLGRSPPRTMRPSIRIRNCSLWERRTWPSPSDRAYPSPAACRTGQHRSGIGPDVSWLL